MLTCNKAGLILFGAEAGRGCCWSLACFLLLGSGETEADISTAERRDYLLTDAC